ncbi:MAG: lamin tail domain-containing protein, partial [Candidatus Saccharimonadales bacterium]
NMKRRIGFVRVGLIAILTLVPLCLPSAQIYADPAPNLVFREIKITGDEFIVLQNTGTGDIAHLSDYWLGYNGDDLSPAPPVQRLPDVRLATNQAILLSGGGTSETCDSSYITKLSPSLSDTKGSLALWQMSGASFNQLVNRPVVSWAKSTKTKPISPDHSIDLYDESDLTTPVWYYDDVIDNWAVANTGEGCTLSIPASNEGDDAVIVASWPENDTQPPAVIISLVDDGVASTGLSLPAADVGLLPPQITELLPNPVGTGTDGTDEFIELYNPNPADFDLTGFILQTGLSTKHSYTFPPGVVLPAKGFMAFYSDQTGLSLSNTTSQADLEDPFGTVITMSDTYNSAKDGLGWALAKGEWYWTVRPTPSASNVINQSSDKKSSTGTTTPMPSHGLTGGATKAASIAKPNTSLNTTSSTSETSEVTPIHGNVLALVAAAAVAYGLYEYRHDVANRYHQLKVYRANRRAGRK